MYTQLSRSRTGILLVLGMLCFFSAIVFAADFNFAGTWKGETSPAAPAAAPSGGTSSPTGGGGRPSGGGGFGGGSSGSGPQKITLRVKVNKEKASGNFTFGSSAAEDIRDCKIEGNKLTFKTGLVPATIYIHEAVLIGDELSVTRTAEGGRGGKPIVFTLKRSK